MSNEDWILSATRMASLGSVTSSTRTVNSSPPILAIVPSLRKHARSLLLTSLIRSVPDGMAVAVIDDLEVVDINEKDGSGLVWVPFHPIHDALQTP